MNERKLLTRRILSVVLALTMALSLCGNLVVLAEREYAAEVSIMGTAVQFANAPYSEYGSVFAPLEELCGYIGIAVSKEGDIYTMTRAGRSVKLQVGNMYAVVDGVQKNLPASPTLRGGIFYVPMEFFSLCFDIPVAVVSDARSADITPNVYTIHIDEQHAAAVSAKNPDEDVLSLTTAGADILRDHMDLYPQKSSYVYYMANLDMFKGKTIERASLGMTVKRNEVGPSITAVRTAPWTKGEITWNNQPVLKEEKSPAFGTSATGNVRASLDITALVNAAMSEGTDLSMKILGTHRAGEKNTKDKHAYTVLGVNSATPPTISITVEETYNFPVKEAVQEDTNDENRYSEMGILRSLGVFTENDEFPLDFNEGVMRYEFIRYALRLANAQIVKGSSQHFSDVPSDAPFFDEVNTARAQGYIAGDAGVAFRPYDFITLGEAITVMGRILNYDVYAEQRGGYAPGYFDAARIGELYMGAATATKILSFNEMFKILRNALDAAVLEVTTYSSNGTAEYIFNENKNILTEYWNAKVIEGTVTKNEYGGRTPGEVGKENQISIGGKDFKLLFKEYNNFLGYRVKGWYDNDDRLLYMGIKEYDITEIDLASVTGDSVSGNTVTFTYRRANGKNASDSFSVENNKKYVIYNGKSIAASDLKNILLSKADGGSIKLIGDSLTVIEAYRTIVVGSVDTNAEVIYDKYDLYNRVLRLKDADYFFKNEDGSKAELKDIFQNDVLSVAASTDGKYVNAIICNKQVSGTIGMIENGDDFENAVVTINGKEYTLANTTKPLLSNTGGKYWTDYVKLNTTATFMLDSFGSIVSVLDTQTKSIPGYIVAMGYKGSLSKQLQAAIMVKGYEKYQIYEFANNVKYNGTKKKEADVKKLFHVENDESKAFVETVVLFDINDAGEISKIDIADTTGTSTDSSKLVKRDSTYAVDASGNITTTANDGTLSYKSGSYKLGDLYFWNYADSLNIVIPDNAESYEDYVSYEKNWSNDANPRADVYTMGTRTPKASVVLIHEKKPGSAVSENSPLVVVDRVVKAFDSDGLEVDKIYYWESPDKKSSAIVTDPDEVFYYEPKCLDEAKGKYADAHHNTSNDDASIVKHPVSDLSRGDIVRVARTEDGELGGIAKYYDYDHKYINGKNNAYCRDRFNKSPRIFGGYTDMIEDSYLRVTPPPYTTSCNESSYPISGSDGYRWIDASKITSLFRYEVSSSGVELIPATLADIRTYENVPYAPTGLLYHTVYESPRGNTFIVEMPQPAGTGLYAITYDKNTTDTVTGMPATTNTHYNAGDIITLPPAPIRVNYVFEGWDIKDTETVENYKNPETVTINGNITLLAIWRYAPSLNFRFEDDNGNFFTWPLTVGESNSLADVLETGKEKLIKEGHVLDGWDLLDEYSSVKQHYALDADFTPDAVAEGVTEGGTFKATWRPGWSGKPATGIGIPTPITDGDYAGYYPIKTPEDLAWFANYVNAGNTTANAILTDDIYLNDFFESDGVTFDEDWYEAEKENGAYTISTANNWYSYSIGRTNAYAGTFDGNGKTIYGLYTTSTESDIGGLFFNITGGTVKDLTVKGAYVISQRTGSTYNTGRASVIANTVNGGTIAGVEAHGLITAAAGCSANLAGSIAVELSGSAVIRNNISYVNIDLSGGNTTLDISAEKSIYGVSGIVGGVKSGSNIIINGNKNYGNITAPYSKAAAGILAWANANTYFNTDQFTGNENHGNIVAGQLANQIIAARKGEAASGNAAFQNLIAQNTASDSATATVYTPAQ